MDEEYWRRFLKTGDVMDYLYYKGMAICKQVMDRDQKNCPAGYEGGKNGESDYSNRVGSCGGTCW